MDRSMNGPDDGNDHFRSIADNSPDVITGGGVIQGDVGWQVIGLNHQ